MDAEQPLNLKLYTSAIDPIISFVKAERGAQTRLVEAYQKHDPTATRQTVESWLTAAAARRRMPPFDRGLLLMSVAAKMMKKRSITPNPQATTTKP